MSHRSFPYLSAHQSRDRAPTEWEVSLAEAIEAAFTAGAYELGALVEHLNGSRVRPPTGNVWTKDNLQAILRELGR